MLIAGIGLARSRYFRSCLRDLFRKGDRIHHFDDGLPTALLSRDKPSHIPLALTGVPPGMPLEGPHVQPQRLDAARSTLVPCQIRFSAHLVLVHWSLVIRN